MSKHTITLANFRLSSHRATSYTLGPIDADTLASLTVDPINAPTFQLLVPGPNDLPTSVLIDAQFRDGAIWGYYDLDWENSVQNGGEHPASIANWVSNTLSWDLLHGDTHAFEAYAFSVGYVLGALSSLAQLEQTLALVGIAHLAFLLLLIPPLPFPLLQGAVHEAQSCHDAAIGAYRARVQELRCLGIRWEEAKMLALQGPCVNPNNTKDQSASTLHAQRQTLDAQRSMTADSCEVA